jgi:hypothetical protein
VKAKRQAEVVLNSATILDGFGGARQLHGDYSDSWREPTGTYSLQISHDPNPEHHNPISRVRRATL